MAMQAVRRMVIELMNRSINNPVVLITDSNWSSADEHLVHFATETGALFLEGMGDGICLGMSSSAYNNAANTAVSGRNYISNSTVEQFINNTRSLFCRPPVQEYRRRNISVARVAAEPSSTCRKLLQRSGMLPIT
jgi:hypothetical protein